MLNGENVWSLRGAERAALTFPDRPPTDRRSTGPWHPSAAGSSKVAHGDGSRRRDTRRARRRARFPRHLSRPQGTGLPVPRDVVQLRDPRLELSGVLLVRRDRFRDSRNGAGDVIHLTSVGEFAGVLKLARKEPHEIPGGRRARVRAVSCPRRLGHPASGSYNQPVRRL